MCALQAATFIVRPQRAHQAQSWVIAASPAGDQSREQWHGRDADNPRFVETLHRLGYRFIATVETDGQPVRNLHVVRPAVSKQISDTATVRLVVLPFANLSNDPTQEYFSDGLTEEMITQLGRLCPGRLGVIARTSSMLFNLKVEPRFDPLRRDPRYHALLQRLRLPG